jgi:hypothetical protein
VVMYKSVEGGCQRCPFGEEYLEVSRKVSDRESDIVSN